MRRGRGECTSRRPRSRRSRCWRGRTCPWGGRRRAVPLRITELMPPRRRVALGGHAANAHGFGTLGGEQVLARVEALQDVGETGEVAVVAEGAGGRESGDDAGNLLAGELPAHDAPEGIVGLKRYALRRQVVGPQPRLLLGFLLGHQPRADQRLEGEHAVVDPALVADALALLDEDRSFGVVVGVAVRVRVLSPVRALLVVGPVR